MTLAGHRILVVEDEALLALALEQDLADAGFETVGPFRHLDTARQAASHEVIDMAILDINLNGETSYPVALELIRRGIPFLFLSGYGGESIPIDFRQYPRLAKPYDPAELTRLLKCLG